MAGKTSLSLSMTDALGTKLSKAVTDVNPDASNAALKAFAAGLAGLTTNTLVTTSKITKEDIPSSLVATKFVISGSLPSFATKVDDYNYNISLSGLGNDFTENGFSFTIGDGSTTYAVATSSFTVSQQTNSSDDIAVPIGMEWGFDGDNNYNTIYFVKDETATAGVKITIRYPGGVGTYNNTSYNLDSTYVTFTFVE